MSLCKKNFRTVKIVMDLIEQYMYMTLILLLTSTMPFVLPCIIECHFYDARINSRVFCTNPKLIYFIQFQYQNILSIKMLFVRVPALLCYYMIIMSVE